MKYWLTRDFFGLIAWKNKPVMYWFGGNRVYKSAEGVNENGYILKDELFSQIVKDDYPVEVEIDNIEELLQTTISLWITKEPGGRVILFRSKPMFYGDETYGWWGVPEDYSQESMELNIYNPLFRYLTVENSPQQVQIDLTKILI